VKVETERKGSMHNPRMPPGASMEMAGKGKYALDLRLSGIASKAMGESQMVVTMKDPSRQPPQTMTTTIKTTQTLESK
jgi:hypothetical protein